MKLITRYNRSLFPAFILLFVSAGLASYFFTRKVLRDEVDETLNRTRTRIVTFINIHQALPAVKTFDDLKVNAAITAVPLQKPELESSRVYIPEQHENHLARQLIFTIWLKKQLYKITVSTPLEGTKTMTKTIVFIFSFTIFFIIICVALTGRAVLIKLWKPFYDSLQLVRNFSVTEGKPLHFPHSEIEEFNIMNDNFKLATDNASKEYRILKEFTENASHEIQTPLAIIRSKLDLLVQQENLSENQSELFQEAYSALTKLSKLNQSLLLLAKIENNQFDKKATISLHKKIENKIIQFQELWHNSHIQYKANINPADIPADPELIEILINNVLSNATRHNVPNGAINITLTQKQLLVTNTGLCKALETDKLFTRFYKATANNDHNGLGLSIIKQICIVTGITPAYSYHEGHHTFAFSWSFDFAQD